MMSRTPSKIAISRTEAASPSMFRTLRPFTADWVMPVLLALGARRHQTTYALRVCSGALVPG